MMQASRVSDSQPSKPYQKNAKNKGAFPGSIRASIGVSIKVLMGSSLFLGSL